MRLFSSIIVDSIICTKTSFTSTLCDIQVIFSLCFYSAMTRSLEDKITIYILAGKMRRDKRHLRLFLFLFSRGIKTFCVQFLTRAQRGSKTQHKKSRSLEKTKKKPQMPFVSYLISPAKIQTVFYLRLAAEIKSGQPRQKVILLLLFSSADRVGSRDKKWAAETKSDFITTFFLG